MGRTAPMRSVAGLERIWRAFRRPYRIFARNSEMIQAEQNTIVGQAWLRNDAADVPGMVKKGEVGRNRPRLSLR